MTGDQVAAREASVRTGLNAVRARIQAACTAAGRPSGDVRLVVVTKTFPASDLHILHGLGCVDIAENKDQEARGKVAELGNLAGAFRWHMIGQVQRNKARSVAGWASVVQSVDRLPLAASLSAGAVEQGRTVDVLIQVALDPTTAAGRGGAQPAEVEGLAEGILALAGLNLAGVMGVAPYPGDPDRAFATLREMAERVRAVSPAAREISAGMSADLEQAVANGATQVRIGGAILGSRAGLQYH
jgi:pyridoxal phosphate enzyme (YggS family)